MSLTLTGHDTGNVLPHRLEIDVKTHVASLRSSAINTTAPSAMLIFIDRKVIPSEIGSCQSILLLGIWPKDSGN